jgi:hypothetical protein
MFVGVALAYSTLPVNVIERHRLGRRVLDRGGEREVQFLLQDDGSNRKEGLFPVPQC